MTNTIKKLTFLFVLNLTNTLLFSQHMGLSFLTFALIYIALLFMIGSDAYGETEISKTQ